MRFKSFDRIYIGIRTAKSEPGDKGRVFNRHDPHSYTVTMDKGHEEQLFDWEMEHDKPESVFFNYNDLIKRIESLEKIVLGKK